MEGSFLPNEEVSFNLNSPLKQNQQQELTLDDLSDANNPRSSNPSSKSSNQIQVQDHIQPSNNNQENHGGTARTVNFMDTATFENSEDERNDIASRWFNARAKPEKKLGQSQESDFDLSETKMNRLNLVNSLKKERDEFSNLLNSYSRQFKDTQSDSTRLSDYTNIQNLHSLPQSRATTTIGIPQSSNSRSALNKYGHLLFRDTMMNECNTESKANHSPQQTVESNTKYEQDSSQSKLPGEKYSENNSTPQQQSTQNNSNSKYSIAMNIFQIPSQTYFQNSSNLHYPQSTNKFQNNNHQISSDNVSSNQKSLFSDSTSTKKFPQVKGLPHFQSQNDNFGGFEGQNDPYIVSINSFKNSLFSAQKENSQHLANRPPLVPSLQQIAPSHHDQSCYEAQSGFIPGKSNVFLYNGSVVSAAGLDSSQIARSALQMHHLAVSGKESRNTSKEKSQQQSNPLANLGKVFGDKIEMKQEFKKRSISQFNQQEDDEENYIRPKNHLGQTPFQKFLEAKNNYQDTFLPEKEKIMNNPLKLLKYKMMLRDKQTLSNCKDTLRYIDQQISNNVDPQIEKESLPPTSLAVSSLALSYLGTSQSKQGKLY